jgi:hypothetical protein
MLGGSVNCSDLKSKNSFGKCFNRCLSTRCIVVKYYRKGVTIVFPPRKPV